MSHVARTARLTRASHLSLLALLPGVVLLASARAGADPKLSLDEALRLAVEASRGVRAGELMTRRAEVLHTGTLAEFGPKVGMDLDWRYWDSDVRLMLDPPGDAAAETRAAIAGSEALVRPRQTWGLGLTIRQPLTGLYSALVGRQLASLELDRARHAEVAERRWVRLKVVEAWHALARAREEVAAWRDALEAAQRLVAAARAAVTAGRARPDDEAWLESLIAEAEQGIDEASAASEVANVRLAMMVGRPLDAPIELGEASEPPAGRGPGGSVDDLLAEALRTREEVARAASVVDSARVARRLYMAEWVPRVDAVFRYARASASDLVPPDSWFIGLVVTWDAWEWGKTWFRYRAAGTELLASLQDLARVKDEVRLETRAAWVRARTAGAALPRATAAASRAELLLRSVEERYSRGEATAVDLRAAASGWIEAQLARIAATHEDAVARWGLREVAGR